MGELQNHIAKGCGYRQEEPFLLSSTGGKGASLVDVGVAEGMDEEWEQGAGRGNPLFRGSEV